MAGGRGLEDAITQSNGRGMGGDEFAYDRGPRVDHFPFAQSLFQAEFLH